MEENSLAVSILEDLPVIVLLNNYMLGMVAQWRHTFYNQEDYSGVHLKNELLPKSQKHMNQGIRVSQWMN